jgi:hypothetical protein
MRSLASERVLFVSALLLCAGQAGCVTTTDPMIPDVYIPVDSGASDAGQDGRLPDPVIDRCEDPGHTLGEACTGPESCDDGCFCNGIERCEGGRCVAGADPCADAIDCTDDACLEETDRCFNMPNHARCSNGLACDGREQCDRLRGCVPAAPLYCNDENACTVDSCDDAVGCVYTPRDLDGDGHVSGSCGGDDCDDDPRYGRMIFPGAPEVCDNRRDDDCDGRRDYYDSDCRPMNDTCDRATVLPARSGTYSGSTEGLAADYALSCASGSAPDAVFRFTLTEPRDVRISISGVSGAAVALRPFAACATGPDLRCSSSASPSILQRSLAPGDYAIIVRTSPGSVFDIMLMIGEPTPVPRVDVCDASTETITASGTFRGRYEETNDHYRLACRPSGSWRDAAYRLVLGADSDVEITASSVGSGFVTTYVSLLTNCSDSATSLACLSGSTVTMRRRGLPAGTYFILLEASTTDATEWTMTVNITTPPAPRQPGDACSTAVPIVLTPGAMDTASGEGSAMLSGAELDGGTGCGGTTPSHRDLYFSFDLTETRDVTITTAGAGFSHFVALQTTCGTTSSELRCRSGSSPFMQVFRSLPAGRYFIVVSTTLSSGTVTARVDTRPPTPVPPNDRCSDAIDMSAGGLRRDTLVGLEDDVGGCTGVGYPDAFYVLRLSARQMVTIIASPPTGSTANMFLTLRDSCSTTANIACASGTSATGGTATIVRTLDPGTYYFMVEMTAATASDFSVRVLVDPP